MCIKTEMPCRLRKMKAGYVCACTDWYCDSLKLPQLNDLNEWMLVTSTESGQRFDFLVGQFHLPHERQNGSNSPPPPSPPPPTTSITAEINQNIVYQEMLGFGGSFTGAVTHILNALPVNLRKCIYKSYYTMDHGLGYTLLRMPIGGCDFDTEPWTYNQYPENDIALSNFTKLHPNDMLRTEIIKECMKFTENNQIKIIGVSWGMLTCATKNCFVNFQILIINRSTKMDENKRQLVG